MSDQYSPPTGGGIAPDQNPPTGGGNNPDPSERHYTQRQVDEMMANLRRGMQSKYDSRIPDEVNAAIARWREENGLGDKELEQLHASRSESEKIKLQLGNISKEAESFKAQNAKLTEALRAATVKTAILRECAAEHVKDPEIVWSMIGSQIEAPPDGDVAAIQKNVSAAVKEFLKTRQFLIEPTAREGGGGAGPGAEGGKKSEDLSTPEARRRALNAALLKAAG